MSQVHLLLTTVATAADDVSTTGETAEGLGDQSAVLVVT